MWWWQCIYGEKPHINCHEILCRFCFWSEFFPLISGAVHRNETGRSCIFSLIFNSVSFVFLVLSWMLYLSVLSTTKLNAHWEVLNPKWTTYIQAVNCRCLSLSQLIHFTDDNSRTKERWRYSNKIQYHKIICGCACVCWWSQFCCLFNVENVLLKKIFECFWF